MRDQHVITYALAHPWALTETMRRTVATVLAHHLVRAPHDWTKPDQAKASPRFVARELVTPVSGPAQPTGVLVLPVHGCLTPHADFFTDISGLASYDDLTEQIRAGVADPKVSTIVLDVDSPGGSAAGATECAQVLLEARQSTRLIAQVNHECCSAGYWLAACADEIVATPSSLLGSVGVYTIHEDFSEALAKLGIKITYVSEGEFKVDGNETEPLSDTAHARMQTIVRSFYDLFTTDVATGRRRTVAEVRSGFGQGQVVTAREGLDLGMVDRIDTLEATITRALTLPPITAPLAARARARSLEAELYALDFQ